MIKKEPFLFVLTASALIAAGGADVACAVEHNKSRVSIVGGLGVGISAEIQIVEKSKLNVFAAGQPLFGTSSSIGFHVWDSVTLLRSGTFGANVIVGAGLRTQYLNYLSSFDFVDPNLLVGFSLNFGSENFEVEFIPSIMYGPLGFRALDLVYGPAPLTVKYYLGERLSLVARLSAMPIGISFQF